MSETTELGPIDYMVLEWQGEQPDAGEVQPLVAAAFAEFEGASSGLLGYDDLQEAAAALDPGTSAAVLVWENRWAAPVAAGTATAVSNRVSRRQANRWQQQGSDPYGQQAPVEQEPRYEEPPPPQQDMFSQLKDLADLKDQGILTEEEFAAQKARILNNT